ncbi:protein CASC3-like [Mytilus californianus]|uniref:protein CASC3-like n=1 Tax=Mytilus californianus TaxID=6549 RepID=UPI0022480AAD|nr:protein CASC3-like [Mytilus californianus]
MADRRRRPHSEAESDEESTETGSTQSPRKPRQSECESEGETKEADLDVSDYESANEDNGEEEEEEDDEEEEESEEEEDDDEEEEGEEYEDEDVIIEDYDEVGEERQSGDGEEQPDKSKLDDDEDRKNPAFIPRQGAFYEHDLRLGEDGQEGLEEDKRPTGPRKKLWQDEGRWNHDKYADYMQAPKSREELITMYGYDIRLADKPPDAPPRRGGGGGPRRPRMDEKPKISDFIQESSRDDSYLVERKNDYNRNRDRYFRGKSEEYRQQDEERGPPPSRSYENQNTGNNNEKHQPPKYDEWNSRYEENQSYRYRSRGDSNKDSGRGYGRNSDSGRGYNRNRDSNRGYERESYQDSNRGYDRPPRREYDNRGYDRPPRREYDNRGQRYDNRDNRDYRSDRGNYEYQRGGRYNGRGYRNDPPRREFTYSRGQRGGRSRPDRGRGVAPRRNFEQERKIPPRFLKKKEQRLQQQLQNNYNTGEYIDHEQNYYNDNVVEGYQLVEGDIEGQHVVIQTETYTPAGGQEDVQQQPQEEKAEEKNENVIVQSSTSERKSYSKDRRARTVGKTRVQDSALNAVQEGMVNLQLQESQKSSKAGEAQDRGEQKSKRSSQGPADNYQASSKQDGGRSKRYSSQRQRNPEQASPDTAQFFPSEVPKGFQKQEVVGPPFQQPILRPPINYPIPVSTNALPNGPPQRLFRPPPVSMTGPVPIIPTQFINTGVIYGAPPGQGPYPVAPIQGFPSPPPVSTAPPPPIPGVSSPNQLQEVYRHGTTYYAPELQYPQIKTFSPVKRTKSAIPIVNPEEVTGNVYVEDVEGERDLAEDQFQVDNRDAMLQETIDREFGFEDQTEAPSLYEGKSVTEPVSDETLLTKTDGQTLETIEHTDSDLDSLSSRLTTDISNYTIAFSTEQEVIDKEDDQDDERNSPVMEVKNSLSVVESVPIVEQEDSLPVDRISPAIEKGDNQGDERNSPVLEVKKGLSVVESSPVVEQADSLTVDDTSPALEDKNSLSVVESSTVVKQDDSLSVDRTSPAIEEKNGESSPVMEEKNSVLADKSSPVPEDTKDTSQEAADASSSPEISVT